MSESLDSFAWLVLGTDPLWEEFVSPSVGIMSACLDRDARPDRGGSWPETDEVRRFVSVVTAVGDRRERELWCSAS